LKTLRHYFVFGAYLGAFAFVAQMVKFWPKITAGVSRGQDLPWWDLPLGLLGFVGLLLGYCLFGGCIGWLVGWAQAYSEKRRRARDETLIVRR
jgi:hypothetical protein